MATATQPDCAAMSDLQGGTSGSQREKAHRGVRTQAIRRTAVRVALRRCKRARAYNHGTGSYQIPSFAPESTNKGGNPGDAEHVIWNKWSSMMIAGSSERTK
jgi:hypothetical protein